MELALSGLEHGERRVADKPEVEEGHTVAFEGMADERVVEDAAGTDDGTVADKAVVAAAAAVASPDMGTADGAAQDIVEGVAEDIAEDAAEDIAEGTAEGTVGGIVVGAAGQAKDSAANTHCTGNAERTAQTWAFKSYERR